MLPFVWPITEDIKVPVHFPLTKDKIRFNGDAVAVVVAETREQALDAAETVDGRRRPSASGHGHRRPLWPTAASSTRSSSPTSRSTGATAAAADQGDLRHRARRRAASATSSRA